MVILIVILIIYNVFFKTNLFFDDIINTLKIWMYHVYPSVFSLYLINRIFIKKDAFKKITFLLKPFVKFENNKSYELFFSCILIGTPGSTATITTSYTDGYISLYDYNKLISLSIFMNPIFVISYLNIKYYFFIFTCQLLTCFIVDKTSKKPTLTYLTTSINSKKISYKDFTNYINEVINLLLMISSIMVVVNIIKFSFSNLFTISIHSKVFLSLFEVSTGLNDVLSLEIENIIKELLIVFLITFQGLSILFQTVMVVDKNSINIKKLLLKRVLYSLITVLVYLFLYIVTSLIP